MPVLAAAWTGVGEDALRVDTLLIGPGVRSGVPILMDNPREVGPDRIVNAVAALARCGGPCIVVDFGTSTNFDAVSAGGEYVGGVLAPGIAISMEALFDRAARLSRVEFVAPPTVIGRNTVHALQSGVVYGFAGQVDGIVRRMSEELGGEPRVLATGGLAGLIVPARRDRPRAPARSHARRPPARVRAAARLRAARGGRVSSSRRAPQRAC